MYTVYCKVTNIYLYVCIRYTYIYTYTYKYIHVNIICYKYLHTYVFCQLLKAFTISMIPNWGAALEPTVYLVIFRSIETIKCINTGEIQTVYSSPIFKFHPQPL